MSRAYAPGKYARATCDQCGFEFKYSQLKAITSDGRQTGLRVCPECWEESHPQEDLGKYPVTDPQALRYARPDPSLEASRQLTGMAQLEAFLKG